jgi:hypothetical protein
MIATGLSAANVATAIEPVMIAGTVTGIESDEIAAAIDIDVKPMVIKS